MTTEAGHRPLDSRAGRAATLTESSLSFIDDCPSCGTQVHDAPPQPLLNLYSNDVEVSVAFYRDHFGFVETYRTPEEGVSTHVELHVDDFCVGVLRRDREEGPRN